MKAQRTELLAILQTLSPALANKELVPGLTHFWLMGQTIHAYNDIIGLELPFESDVTGAVHGASLLGVLGQSRAAEISLDMGENGEAKLKAAGAVLKLAVIPADRSLWQPEWRSEEPPIWGPEVITALERVLISVGDDPAMPEHMGVTFIIAAGTLAIYATDSKTVTRAILNAPEGMPEGRFIAPTPFCQQLVRLGSAGVKVDLSENDIMVETENDVRLFGRLVEVSSPKDFETVISRYVTDENWNNAVAVPQGLEPALERALTVLADVQPPRAVIEVQAKMARLSAKGSHAEVERDSVALEHECPPARLTFNPALAKRGLKHVDRMVVLADALVFFGGEDFVYLIAGISGSE